MQEQNPDVLRFWMRQGDEVTGLTKQTTPRRQNIIQLLHESLASPEPGAS